MGDFFDRKKILIIDDMQFEYPTFEIVFSGHFDDDPEPDIYEINIYNLTQTTIDKIKKKSNIILNAGYGDDVGNVFAGKIKDVNTVVQGSDKITTIIGYNSPDSWIGLGISKSFNGPVSGKVVITEAARLLGLEIGDINLVDNKIYQNGKTLFGRGSAEIRRIVKECESSMIINNGKILITDSVSGFETGFVLNSDTGLIGRPEKIDSEDTKSEYKITMLFNHRIAPRSIIQLESKTINGIFTVVKGDIDDDFNQEVELITFRR